MPLPPPPLAPALPKPLFYHWHKNYAFVERLLVRPTICNNTAYYLKTFNPLGPKKKLKPSSFTTHTRVTKSDCVNLQ